MTNEELLEQFLARSRGDAPAPAVPVDQPTPQTVENEALLEEFVARGSQVDEPATIGGRPTRQTRQEEREVRSQDTALDRAREAVTLGLSDAFSTLAGDVYTSDAERVDMPLTAIPVGIGEEGVELRDPLAGNRLLRATAQAVRGGGAALGEVIGAADAELGSPLGRSLEAMQERREAHPIYAGSGIEQAVSDIEEAYPEYADTIKDVTEVGLAAGAYAPMFRAAGGTRRIRNLPEGDRLQRRTQIEERWTPRLAFDDPQSEVTFTGGIMDKRKVRPKEGSARQRMIDDLESIEGLNPRDAAGKNFLLIDSEVEKMRRALDNDLTGKRRMSMDDVTRRLDSAQREMQNVPALQTTGAQAAFDATRRQWDRIVDQYVIDGTISPKDLLQARRDLDTWLQNNQPKMLEAGTLSGQGLAIKHIRRNINEAVADHVPTVDVTESLRKQSSLLNARDEIRTLANFEAGNRFTRALQETQVRYGLAMPHSPAAVGANIEPVPLAIGTGLLAANRFGGAATTAGRYGGAAASGAGQTAYNVGRGFIPGISLPEDDEQRVISEYIRRN